MQSAEECSTPQSEWPDDPRRDQVVSRWRRRRPPNELHLDTGARGLPHFPSGLLSSIEAPVRARRKCRRTAAAAHPSPRPSRPRWSSTVYQVLDATASPRDAGTAVYRARNQQRFLPLLGGRRVLLAIHNQDRLQIVSTRTGQPQFEPIAVKGPVAVDFSRDGKALAFVDGHRDQGDSNRRRADAPDHPGALPVQPVAASIAGAESGSPSCSASRS